MVEQKKVYENRRVGFDSTTLDDKIITDDDERLVIPTVIASEIVQQLSLIHI